MPIVPKRYLVIFLRAPLAASRFSQFRADNHVLWIVRCLAETEQGSCWVVLAASTALRFSDSVPSAAAPRAAHIVHSVCLTPFIFLTLWRVAHPNLLSHPPIMHCGFRRDLTSSMHQPCEAFVACRLATTGLLAPWAIAHQRCVTMTAC